MRPSRNSGFSLIELLIVIALISMVSVKIFMVLQTASKAQAAETAALALDDQSRRVLDRIAYAVMGSTRDTLFPDPESPVFSDSLEFEISLGVDEQGQIVWGDTERISLSDLDTQVVWQENPGLTEERRVVWCNTVRPFLEGEEFDGVDNNGNGLIDEKGLTFSLDGDAVTIRLTLERMNKDGTAITHSVETVATCRN